MRATCRISRYQDMVAGAGRGSVTCSSEQSTWIFDADPFSFFVMFGEVGLAGEIRPVQRGQERLKEAAKLGFTQAIVPAVNQPKQKISGMEIHAVHRLDEAIRLFRET